MKLIKIKSISLVFLLLKCLASFFKEKMFFYNLFLEFKHMTQHSLHPSIKGLAAYMQKGMESFFKRIQKQQALYDCLVREYSQVKASICHLNESVYEKEIIELFGPSLSQKAAKVDLTTIYGAAFHPKTHSLIVANQGATLLCSSPLTHTPFLVRHIGCCVYHPGLGEEIVNIGLVGDIYEGDVILRSESACIPSFLFGSQRCNCCYQWASVRELASYLNPVQLPALDSLAMEEWIRLQFTLIERQHRPVQKGVGLILMHLDSQSGMGSGFSPQEFAYDLYGRALLRQLGENTAEQRLDLNIKGGYDALGLPADGRLGLYEAGYQLPAILLDWLQCSRSIICLSNNRHKLDQLVQAGYKVTRVKSLGMINRTGAREANQRKSDFQQMDIDGTPISFEEEIERLKTVFGPYKKG